jgi:hypothetical protein
MNTLLYVYITSPKFHNKQTSLEGDILLYLMNRMFSEQWMELTSGFCNSGECPALFQNNSSRIKVHDPLNTSWDMCHVLIRPPTSVGHPAVNTLIHGGGISESWKVRPSTFNRNLTAHRPRVITYYSTLYWNTLVYHFRNIGTGQ